MTYAAPKRFLPRSSLTSHLTYHDHSPTQVGRGSGGGSLALPSGALRGHKVNVGGLLASLRELSAHLSGGYGWPASADRVAPLCGRYSRTQRHNTHAWQPGWRRELVEGHAVKLYCLS